MRRFYVLSVVALALLASIAIAQAPSTGPYSVMKTAKVGGAGNFDYVYADSDGRKLYVARRGQNGPNAAPDAPKSRISVYNLDTLELVNEIVGYSAAGAAVDPKSGHGFASSSPVVMWDTKTLAVIKTIDVQGGPDGILFDPFNQRVWIFSHRTPNATIINTAEGTIAGTMDLGGSPEQAVTDGKGHLYVDMEDKDQIAAVDAKTLTVTAHWDISAKGQGPGGLGFDAKNHVLFASCHGDQQKNLPPTMVILSSEDGKILDALPIGNGTDGATFNPATMEAFSSNSDGTLTIIKENSPTSFVVEQNLKTMPRAKTLTLDSKTNHILLIAAEYGPPPTPPAGTPPPEPGRGGRGRGGPMLPDSFTILAVGK
jgi:DNA-binding beta-propeller fold protein YncE